MMRVKILDGFEEVPLKSLQTGLVEYSDSKDDRRTMIFVDCYRPNSLRTVERGDMRMLQIPPLAVDQLQSTDDVR